MKRRRRWGKDGDERRITKKSGSAQGLPSPALLSGPASHRAQPPGAAPTPAEPLPAATGQRKSPAARPDPARGRPAALPVPGAPRAAPGLLKGRSPATTITSPCSRAALSPQSPRRPMRRRPRANTPSRAGPAPLGRETMSSHNSPAAPELRGAGGGSFAPSPSRSPPPRSGIRPPGAEPPSPCRSRASAGPPAALPPRGKSLYSPLQHGCSPRRRRSSSFLLAVAPRRRHRRAAAGRAREAPGRALAVPRASAEPGRGGVRGRGEPRRAGLGCASPLRADASARSL